MTTYELPQTRIRHSIITSRKHPELTSREIASFTALIRDLGQSVELVERMASARVMTIFYDNQKNN